MTPPLLALLTLVKTTTQEFLAAAASCRIVLEFARFGCSLSFLSTILSFLPGLLISPFRSQSADLVYALRLLLPF